MRRGEDCGGNLFSNVMAAAALVVSLASLLVSILGYRSAGPRVSITSHSFSVRGEEVWLEVRLANAGSGEVDVDGASCDLLGPTVSSVTRLKSAASHLLLFRAPVSRAMARAGSVTVNVGFGDGRNLVKQVRTSDKEQAEILAVAPLLRSQKATKVGGTWRPPLQEEI